MAQSLFQQLVWDENSQSFVTHNTRELNSTRISYFIWDGSDLDFFLSSGTPYDRINVVDYDLPEFKGLYYNNMYLQSGTYSVNGDINFIAYYGAEPDNSGSSDSDIPEEGYTLSISYTHTYYNNIYEQQSVQHYGAWVNDEAMEYVFYYDENKNIQRIDRHILVEGSGVFDIPKFSSNLHGYSEENPYYGNAEVKYYLSEPAKVWITIVKDEEGNVRGTTNPAPNKTHTLKTNIGEYCEIYAQPDLGYKVDHWSEFNEDLNEWIDSYYSSVSYEFQVTEPQHTHQIRAYFKKKTFSDDMFSGVTKIATKEDLNQLIDGGFWSNDITRCPTKYEITLPERIIDTKYYKIKVNSDYKNNQAVKCEDCELKSSPICFINYDNITAQDGGNCIFSELWNQVDGNTYEASLDVYGSVYSNDTIVDNFNMVINFTGTLDNGYITSIRGVAEPFTITVRDYIVTKIQLDEYSPWYSAISTGRTYSLPDTYAGGNHYINWHITFEFNQR